MTAEALVAVDLRLYHRNRPDGGMDRPDAQLPRGTAS